MSFTYVFNLESRQLLSHGGQPKVPTPVDPAVFEAAKAAVMMDYQKLLSHLETNRAKVSEAKAQMKANFASYVAELDAYRVQIVTAQEAVSAAEAVVLADKARVTDFWAPILAERQLDVDTVMPWESADEQAQDLADLQFDQEQVQSELAALDAAWAATRDGLDDVVDDIRDDMRDATKEYKRTKRVDQRAVQSAQRTMKNVFQSDRRILESEIKSYRKQGFKLAALDLPKLPRVSC